MIKLALVALTSVLMVSGFAAKQSDQYEGRPAYKESDAGGYYVWHNGNNWHVRWIAVDRPRDFRGSVVAEGGALRDLRQANASGEVRDLPWLRGNVTVTVGRANSNTQMTGMAPTDRANIRNDGKSKIVFDVRTENNIGGFDFSPADGATTLKIDLQVDGKSTPNRVRIGGGGQQPDLLPLVVAIK
jgi:hypothetical protein